MKPATFWRNKATTGFIFLHAAYSVCLIGMLAIIARDYGWSYVLQPDKLKMMLYVYLVWPTLPSLFILLTGYLADKYDEKALIRTGRAFDA